MKMHAAEDVCSMVEEMLLQMQALNNYVITNCEASEIERIIPALTRCVAELDLEILAPIHKEYPSLKPSFLP